MPFSMNDMKEIVLKRMKESAAERKASRMAISAGKPLNAENNTELVERYVKRLASRDSSAPRDGAIKILKHNPPLDQGDLTGAEKVVGPADFVNVCFLSEGARAARAVGHIDIQLDGECDEGTGFLVAPGLLLTNWHLLQSEAHARSAEVVFNFEVTADLKPCQTTRFKLDPDTLFISSTAAELDFALVAVGAKVSGPEELASFGYLPLRADIDCPKGMPINIIQHPGGYIKRVVVRQNRLAARGKITLHYESDTEKGSSGSPAMNDFWEVVGLHHWCVPNLEKRTVDGFEIPISVNEGVLISAILDHLRRLEPSLTPEKRALLAPVLNGTPCALGGAEGLVKDAERHGSESPQRAPSPEPVHPAQPVAAHRSTASSSPSAPDGALATATLTLPLEVSFRFRLPGSAATAPAGQLPLTTADLLKGAEGRRIDRNYRNRHGYNQNFLGIPVPLPALSSALQGKVAALSEAEANRQSGVMRYEHFSVVINAERRLAFFSAVNVDGRTYIDVDRATGTVLDGAEGDTWYKDSRIDPEYVVGPEFYSANSQYYDKGHLTRRNDPTWGSAESAERANTDTFHFTNCAPQHWRFNESTDFWQGVERHYLEYGAKPEQIRISVFTGPVLSDRDPELDGVKVPMSFWKIVARVEDGALRATGFLVSQDALISEPRRRIRRPDDDAPPPQVDQFICSISQIEELTGLDFGPLTAADTFESRSPSGGEGLEKKLIRSWDDLPG